MHTVMLIQEWASIASNVGAERRRAGLQRDVSGHGPGCLGAGATGGAPSNGVPSEDVAPTSRLSAKNAPCGTDDRISAPNTDQGYLQPGSRDRGA